MIASFDNTSTNIECLSIDRLIEMWFTIVCIGIQKKYIINLLQSNCTTVNFSIGLEAVGSVVYILQSFNCSINFLVYNWYLKLEFSL